MTLLVLMMKKRHEHERFFVPYCASKNGNVFCPPVPSYLHLKDKLIASNTKL